LCKLSARSSVQTKYPLFSSALTGINCDPTIPQACITVFP
jgi:hypothetical protein